MKVLIHSHIKYMDGYREQDWDSYLEVDKSMEDQEEIQKKIEGFAKIDDDIENGIKPF